MTAKGNKAKESRECADCLKPFFKSRIPGPCAVPGARSFIHPTLCVRCSSVVLAKLDPPLTFAQVVEAAWRVGPNAS